MSLTWSGDGAMLPAHECPEQLGTEKSRQSTTSIAGSAQGIRRREPDPRTMPVVVALIPRAASTIKEVVPRPIREMSTGTTSSGFRKPLIGDGETPGMKGMNADGLPRPAFRGRWATRNAVFCDLMVRTGLRLAEQSALTVFDLPTEHQPVSYQRFRLPEAIAKGSSTRWVYIPESIVRELINYRDGDRRQIIDDARAHGRYDKIARPLVVEDPAQPIAVDYTNAGVKARVKVSNLDHTDRRRLYIAGDRGLEPASFWLTERGMPVSVSRWKGLFHEANVRCADVGIPLRVHPHMLRHTFAVVTLEQLQRGHIAALREQTAEQRGHYTRIFGDPLDWVRRRMGHRSITTTMI